MGHPTFTPTGGAAGELTVAAPPKTLTCYQHGPRSEGGHLAAHQLRMFRRSAWNTSEPESQDGVHALHFLRFGRVPLDVHERVPPQRLITFAEQVHKGSEGAISPEQTHDLLLDTEAGVMHWAADQLADGSPDITHEIESLTKELATLLERIVCLSREEKKTFARIIDRTSPQLRKAIWKSDSLDPPMLRACMIPKRMGPPRKADAAITAMLDGFIDDWKRMTGVPINSSESAGSAQHFFITALELMAEYPPSGGSCVVRAKAADELSRLRHAVDKPWLRAVRNEAERLNP